MAGIKFEIQENLGVISESANGWTKELNLVSWNDRPVKFDIRDWDENHQKMGKGLTLSIDELRELKKVLNEINL
nr:PC4/YdbC family ssDNA-binding protein [Paeniclostridium ghonii]